MATAADTTIGTDTEYDEFGNPKKKAVDSTVPTQDPNASNSTVALSQAAKDGAAAAAAKTSTGYDTVQGNTDVLGQAQQSVLSQPATSQLQDATTKSTLNWVNNPMGDYNPQKVKQSQMDAANNGWANSFEGLRQQYGDQSGSGLIQKNMLQNALQHNTDMNTLSGNIDTDNYNKYVDSLGKSIAAGQSTNQSNEDVFSQRLGNLQTVRNMGEGERAQTTGFSENVALTNLGYDNATQQAATAHGYDLEKLNATYGLEATKAAVAHGYDLDTLAATFGNDIAKMGVAQGYDLDKMNAAFGMDMTKMVAQSNLDTASKTSLMNLQDQIDTKQMLTKDDFTAVQNDLDRQSKIALQNGDIAGQKAIETLKGQIAEKAQAAQNDFTKTLTASTQAWQTGENITKQQSDQYMQALDLANKKAIDQNDTETQANIASEKNKLDLAMQTNTMDQQTKMAYLADALTTAQKNGDVGRQKDIINFQTTQDLEKAAQQGNIDQAKITLQGNIQQALADKDYVKATALQQSQFAFQSSENAKDRAITQAAEDLKAKGYNSDLLLQGIKDGSIDPDAGLQMLTNAGKALGVTVSPPDPLQEQKDADQSYKMLQYQYSLSHPGSMAYTATKAVTYGYVNDESLTTTVGQSLNQKQYDAIKAGDASAVSTDKTLTPEALSDFNDFVNQATSGKEITSQSTPQDVITDIVANPNNWIGADKPGSPNNKSYQNALDSSTEWTQGQSNLGSNGYQFANGVPDSGTMFKQNGKLYIANTTGIEVEKRSGAPDKQYFMAKDVTSGISIKFST